MTWLVHNTHPSMSTTFSPYFGVSRTGRGRFKLVISHFSRFLPFHLSWGLVQHKRRAPLKCPFLIPELRLFAGLILLAPGDSISLWLHAELLGWPALVEDSRSFHKGRRCPIAPGVVVGLTRVKSGSKNSKIVNYTRANFWPIFDAFLHLSPSSRQKGGWAGSNITHGGGGVLFFQPSRNFHSQEKKDCIPKEAGKVTPPI